MYNIDPMYLKYVLVYIYLYIYMLKNKSRGIQIEH